MSRKAVYLLVASAAMVLGYACAAGVRIRAATASEISSHPLYLGFNFTHANVLSSDQSDCASKGGTTNIAGRDALIANYDDPSIRKRAISVLTSLHELGASVVRTVFWFRSAEDIALDKTHPARNPLGVIVTRNGSTPSQDIANLVQFVADVQHAGYKQLVLALGNQGRSNPPCRANGVWGACYDPRFDALEWSAAEQMIRAVKSKQFPGLDVFFDIAGESCFVRDNSLLERNLEHYARYMAENYIRAFGDNKYIISCGGGDADRTVKQLSDTSKFFAQLRPKPAFIDVHDYFTDPRLIQRVLSVANATAQQLGANLMIGETFANNNALFQLIKAMRSRSQLNALRDLLVWPRQVGSKCEIDVAPQNMLRWVTQALPASE